MPRYLLLSLAISMPFVSGCAKKAAPVTAPEAAVETAAELSPSPAPPAAAARPAAPSEPDIWSRDLTEIDAWARSQGLLGDVFFDFDRAELGTEARERLAKNAEFLRQYPQISVTIEGHCDERGTSDYNIALGDQRASSALGYLRELGVSSSQLRAVSFGKERPQCAESNESCWWRNRRAAFQVTGRDTTGAAASGS